MQPETPRPLTVYLVGAGPGDPGLLTCAGSAALQRAAAVIYDHLANPELLALCPPDAEKIYVGKTAGHHAMRQDRINALLVEKARSLARGEPDREHANFADEPVDAAAAQHPNISIPMLDDFSKSIRCVVRLKGGDPYVFGRGGEEAEFLAAANVPCVVIPGVTAGIAGPAYAGIPVTHRDLAGTVTFIAGHEREKSGRPDADSKPGEQQQAAHVDYAALAQLGGTLVFYMGVKTLPTIAEQLVAHGLPADTPAAVVQWATTQRQRGVVGTVATIAGQVHAAGITAPAITIVGQTVRLRERLNWFESRPLFGKTVLVTRTRQQASDLSEKLKILGAHVIEAPTIVAEAMPLTEHVADVLRHMDRYICVIFSSANGVEAAFESLRKLGLDARALKTRVAAIGPATANALCRIGVAADIVPSSSVGEALARAVTDALRPRAGDRVLLLRAEIARPILREQLEASGALVDDIALYRTVRSPALPDAALAALTQDQVDLVTFTSASTADNLHALLSEPLREKVRKAVRASIGPITSAALEKLNWSAQIRAERHDIAGLVEAIQSEMTRDDRDGPEAEPSRRQER